MKNILIISIFLLLSASCATTKYVEIPYEVKTEYRDSLIYIRDTVEIPIETVQIKEIIPQVDTSYLETELAHSTAYLDTNKGKLHHTLEQSGTVKTQIDTFVIVEYIDKYIEKPIIKEVEVPVKYIPSFFKFCLYWFIASVILIILFLYFKIKPF